MLGKDDFNQDSVLSVLEDNFLWNVYIQNSKATEIYELRWGLFGAKRNLVLEKISPTHATLGYLMPHFKRANFVAQVSKGYKVPEPKVSSL